MPARPARPQGQSESIYDRSLIRFLIRRRKRRGKVYSGANAVNEEDPERDRATQV